MRSTLRLRPRKKKNLAHTAPLSDRVQNWSKTKKTEDYHSGKGEIKQKRTQNWMKKKGMKGAPGLDAYKARQKEHEDSRGKKMRKEEAIDEIARKHPKLEENPYSMKNKLKMVGSSIKDRVKQKARALTTTHKESAELEKAKINHKTTKKGGKTIHKVNKNDESDAQAAMKNDPKYILGKTRVQAEGVKNCGCGKDPCETYGEQKEKKRKNALQIQKYIGEKHDTPKNVKKIAKELDAAVKMHASQAKRLRKAGLSEEETKSTEDKQIETKKKRMNMIKKQILQKKLMAVRAGADGVAS